MTKNEHLIPVSVLDVAEKLSKATNENEINNYVHRLEVTRDFCAEIVMKHRLSKPVVRPNTRRMP